jgi:predicted nucleic acid-binding protein
VGLGVETKERVNALLKSGELIAVSDLVRMECQVGPLKANDQLILAQYVTFFQSPDASVPTVSAAVCDRAAQVRARYGFKPLDSLHLAAAVEYRCTLFLTGDSKLKIFHEIPVEILM